MKAILKTLALAAASLSLFAAAPPVKKPKLVLAIVVDQFRYDYLTRFRADYKAGLAQLIDKGAVFTDGHQDHFPTVTAVGHSTFLVLVNPVMACLVAV